MALLVSVCAGVVNGNMLLHLAKCIGVEWRDLAVTLGIPRGRIETIRRSLSTDKVSALTDMLTSWLKRLPRSADKVLPPNHGPVSK